MAADWIKMRTDLYRDPKISVIADELMDTEGRLARYVSQYCQRDMSVTRNVTRNAVVGALVAVWGVMRQRGKRRGDDLVCAGVTPRVLDDIADLPGFGSAMESAGWVIESPQGIEFPNFFEENNVDPSEKKSASAAERQRKYRERKKSLVCDGDSDVTRDVTVTPREEKRREEKESTKVDSKSKKFIPPTVAQVAEYCQARGNTVPPQTFVDHYTGNGWMRGKSKVKDWQACVRTWETNQNANNQRNTGTNRSDRNTQAHRDYIADLERQAEVEAGRCLADPAEPALGY